jgi:DNA-binding GntR family transcriptional regulator
LSDSTLAIAPPLRVVDRLRTDIVEGIWRQDERLRSRDLAAHYGVSSAPIREALQQLQGEGLVVQELNRGARVRPVDEQLLINVYDVREAMESFLTARFTVTASPYQISVLKGMQAEHDEATEREDCAVAIEVNRRFHKFINDAARNPEASEVINRRLSLTRAVAMECGYSLDRTRAVRDEHHALIGAISRGDEERVRRLAALHVRSSRDDLVERFRALRKK